MGQKINPLSFRLGITQNHRAQWFVKKTKYSQLLLEDIFLRKIINFKYQDAGITEVKIKRKLNQIQIEIKTARPSILIGREGNTLEVVRVFLEKEIKIFRNKNFFYYKKIFPIGFSNPQVTIHITKIINPDKEACFLANFLAEQIQKRIPFRRAIKQTLQRVRKSGVKGIKIQISGRLNGAEIARSEWIRDGRVPLQTLRANIDYSYKTAKTIYGIIGIKVWIFKGLINNIDNKR